MLGIENYSPDHLRRRRARPMTLRTTSQDFLLFVDESHATCPGPGQYAGDGPGRSPGGVRLRLPSASTTAP
jgi:excinuclease UvrABC helicase subunit UvrB